MKTLIKGFFVFGLLAAVSPVFGAETVHHTQGLAAELSQGSPAGLLGILEEGDKSQLVAALLAWFLGGIGIHLFYLGYRKKGLKRLFNTLSASLLIVLGELLVVAAATSGASATIGSLILVAGLILLAISWIKTIIEFIRIISGSLKPANGEYK